jgi:hypothetical protein
MVTQIETGWNRSFLKRLYFEQKMVEQTHCQWLKWQIKTKAWVWINRWVRLVKKCINGCVWSQIQFSLLRTRWGQNCTVSKRNQGIDEDKIWNKKGKKKKSRGKEKIRIETDKRISIEKEKIN